MLARGALCRLGVSQTSARDLPQLPQLPQRARFLQRTLLSRNASSLLVVRALSRAYTSALEARRSYATTTGATKPTATVKRAVKAKAAEKAPSKKRATKATAAKTAKKPKAATKAKPKAKKATKKAPRKKKAAPKKRAPKVLTPEQEEKANIKNEKAKIKKEKARLVALRKTALREPASSHALSAYLVYVIEQTKGKSAGAGSGSGAATSRITETSQKWKALTPAEHEHYNHLAHERNAARQAEYRAWIHSHTPQEIHAANNARAQLRRLLKNTSKRRYPAHTSKIIDDREVKRPTSSYAKFSVERFASGDFKNIKVPEASKLIAEEWKTLSAGEKKKYEDMFAADKERYARESAAVS